MMVIQIFLPHLKNRGAVDRTAESGKPRQRVSNADQKVFANPESFATILFFAEEFPDTLQYKISR